MPKKEPGKTRNGRAQAAPRHVADHRFCSMPHEPPRRLEYLPSTRSRAILQDDARWMNGKDIKFYFFDNDSDGRWVAGSGHSEWRSWVGAESQKSIVRDAFRTWKAVGIGLAFTEVFDRREAEVRIGFEQGDGSWSFLGNNIVRDHKEPNERTMNFGWSLEGRDGLDTALHEIGHTLGLPHEHQNPFAGIEWDEEAVYQDLAGAPNYWDRATTFHNMIRKIEPDEVQASAWDPHSIMHYPIKPRLIRRPEAYSGGLNPAGGLSARDRAWVLRFYPPIADGDLIPLRPSLSQEIPAKSGEQANYLVEPPSTRIFDIRTFGTCDTAMTLQEDQNGTWVVLVEDDDSGEDRNAAFQIKLFARRRYALRVRMKYSDMISNPAVMII